MASNNKNMQDDNIYFNEGLEYYIYLGLGSKEDFEKEIEEHGADYCKYYYDESYNDTFYQGNRGNVFIPTV